MMENRPHSVNDSKSPFPRESVGSIPTSGTNHIKGFEALMLLKPFFVFI
jgi:hypothetical protein